MEEVGKVLKALVITKEMEEAKRDVIEHLVWNRTPYESKYFSDYMGDQIEVLKFKVVYEDGSSEEVPYNYSVRYANRHIEGYDDESGVGLAEFIIQKIAEGKKIVKIKVKEKIDDEIRERYEDREYEVPFDNDILRAAVIGVLRSALGPDYEYTVKPFGSGAHVVIPKEWIGKSVLVIPIDYP